jgi:3-oxoacyl-[acyl-carrier-protein] synthase II
MVEDNRVVITGMGVVSPVGLNVSDIWQSLIQGCSGIGLISGFDTSEFDVKIGGEVRGFDPQNYMSAKDARRTDRFTQYAVASMTESLNQSGLRINSGNAHEIGAVVGSGVGGIWTYTQELDVLRTNGPRRVSPFLIPAITVDVPSVHIALLTGAKGPNFGVASACATGAQAIGESYEIIKRGHAKAMFAGGVEAALTPIGVASFDRMRALSRHNDDPQGASRPFDFGRDGFVISDGGAVLVLEALDFALQRGARPLAEILAYSTTSDAAHLAAPDVNAQGAATCMALAIQRAGLRPEEISYINAHGTSTQAGDAAETRAIKHVFGAAAANVPVSSTKSMTGHMLGGAGAMEAVICVQALLSEAIPPTINLHDSDPECDLDYVANQARPAALQAVLSNSFGFGGHNVCLIFGAV